MLLCAITDRRIFPGDEHARRHALLVAVRAWTAAGVDFLQIREKDLAGAELLALAREVAAAARDAGMGAAARTLVLLNGPAAIALEAGCDGVHLTGAATPEAAAEARSLFAAAGRQAFVSQSCHAPEEVAASDADLLLFAPVFEKSLARAGGGALAGSGLEALSAACQAAEGRPVLALGGVTLENAHACVAAGAAGIAAIRLFANKGLFTNEELFAGEDWRRLRP